MTYTDFPVMSWVRGHVGTPVLHGHSVKPPFIKSGTVGWVALAALVIGWDALAPETMSDAFQRNAATPAGRACLIAIWGALTLHLFEALPKNTDPFELFLEEVLHRERVCGGELLP